MTVVAPDRSGTTALPDGRRLAWSEWGPPDGRPVLLFPGAATSRWLGLDVDAVRGLDVRVVSIDRPGLGCSDPAPGRTLSSWALDVGELVRLRGLGRPSGVAFSQGAPFALACAEAEVVDALAVVSGTDELAASEVRGQLVPDVQRLVALSAAAPDDARRAFAELASTEAMWQMVMAMSSGPDQAVYREPAFTEAYRRAMDEAFRQGPAAYAEDTLLTMRPWPFDVATISVPVDLWYGRLDVSPVHSPDLGRRLHGLIAGSTHRVVEDGGAAILWTHGREIVSALLRDR